MALIDQDFRFAEISLAIKDKDSLTILLKTIYQNAKSNTGILQSILHLLLTWTTKGTYWFAFRLAKLYSGRN